MPITIEEPRAAGLPVVKRTAIGQTFVGAVLKTEQRDRLKKGDDGVARPELKPDGKPKQELVVTCLALPGTNCDAGLGDDEAPIKPGDVVRTILYGKSFGDWIEQKRALGRGLAVGDVVTHTTDVAQVYDANGSPTGGHITDNDAVMAARMKGKTIGIYGPLTLAAGREPEWVAKAEEAYHGLKTPIPVEPDMGDEEPF